MDKNIETTIKSINSRNMKCIYAENREEANLKILDLIPLNSAVGIGDSTSLRQIGIIKILKNRGTKVLDGFERGISKVVQRKLTMDSMLCNIFLTGTNAITLDGRLVNVDGSGNRVAGMFYGPAISIIVVGRNKIVDNLNQAFNRIRKLIAPNHLRIRNSLLSQSVRLLRREEIGVRRPETSCIKTGKCIDCRTKHRACNIFTIIEGKPLHTDIYVVVVDEDLGLAWDESWSNERVSSIIEDYKEFVWNPDNNYYI